MNKFSCIILLLSTILTANYAFAAIALDRTRVIFEGNNKAISVNISNENKQLPYLAQAWIEDENQKKVTEPLIVTPPVQRVEPGSKSMVKISAMPTVNTLPQDRETLFYFNLREIPPRSDKPNVMQIALQTKIKLFYRPSEITVKAGDVWQNKLVLTKNNGGYRIENPTPFFITIVGIGVPDNKKEIKDFKPVLLAPKSSRTVSAPVSDTPLVTYINDYGGRPTLKFRCQEGRCLAIQA